MIATAIMLCAAFALGWALRARLRRNELQAIADDRAAWVDVAADLYQENRALRRVALVPEPDRAVARQLAPGAARRLLVGGIVLLGLLGCNQTDPMIELRLERLESNLSASDSELRDARMLAYFGGPSTRDGITCRDSYPEGTYGADAHRALMASGMCAEIKPLVDCSGLETLFWTVAGQPLRMADPTSDELQRMSESARQAWASVQHCRGVK